jgi:hypothetical protein
LLPRQVSVVANLPRHAILIANIPAVKMQLAVQAPPRKVVSILDPHVKGSSASWTKETGDPSEEEGVGHYSGQENTEQPNKVGDDCWQIKGTGDHGGCCETEE